MTQTKKHSYKVTIPIAGHVTIEVEANSEKEAKELAFDSGLEKGDLCWEYLERFNKGKVCYCPSPWSIQIDDNGDVED